MTWVTLHRARAVTAVSRALATNAAPAHTS
eukprot:COSAG05_NODE_20877_length_276_cov_0.587571_1_plen_29_part_10